MVTSDIHNYGSADVERLLTDLAIAVRYHNKLSVETKNDIAELLSAFTCETATNAHSITPFMCAVVSDIDSSLASTGLVGHWGKIKVLVGLYSVFFRLFKW